MSNDGVDEKLTSPRFWITAVLTAAFLLAVIVGSILAFTRIDKPVQLSTDGKTVLADPYGRAKDYLTLFLPLVTIVVGYWFGSAGTEQAKSDAKSAKADTAAAKAETAKQKAATNALQTKAQAQPDLPAHQLFSQLVAEHPQAFGQAVG